jgi:pilus assembly protein CpaC
MRGRLPLSSRRRQFPWLQGIALVCLLLGNVSNATAQRILDQPHSTLSIPRGGSVLITNPTQLQRFSMADPAIAEAIIVSPTELVVNGKALGSTSLLLWDASGSPRLYAVEVTADAAALERYLKSVMPAESISVTANGSAVALSGRVSNSDIATQALSIAEKTGVSVIDNLQAPPAIQVLLEVRIAEINRTALRRLSTQIAALNPQSLDPADAAIETVSDGLVVLSLLNVGDSLGAVIRALSSRGELRTLAEPNLLTLPGKEAYFLAGGEFPYPSVQGGTGNNAVIIVFKEFGVRLRFTPTLARGGAIRLHLAPEVSSLDFANALVISGFTIPSLLTRRTETDIELMPGQHLAIAGLLDNSALQNISKIPILGDIPILGQLFRSRDVRQRRSELVVIVTPHLVQPSNEPIPLPTGEPDQWKWDKSLRKQAPANPGPRQ